MPRVRIALPVHFDDGDTGLSRDISAAGLFVHADRVREPGDLVAFSLTLGEWDAGGGFRVQGEGRVVRVEAGGPRPGIALDVQWANVEALLDLG